MNLSETPSSKEIKASARDLLVGNYQKMALAFVFFFIVSNLAENLFGARTSSSLVISTCAEVLITLFLSLFKGGMCCMALRVSRKEHIENSDLFYAFSHHGEKLLLIALIETLFTLAGMIPATFGIVSLFKLKSYPIVAVTVCILACALSVALIAALNILYSQSFFIWIDRPSLSPLEMMKESRRLIRGRELAHLKLFLSFFGMFLLCLVTFGIALLWVHSYMRVSFALFYRSLLERDRGRRQQKKESSI